MSLSSGEAAKAFGLVIMAGGATAFGAASVFFPKLIQMANRKTLSASLAFASGVMLYVSLVDIYGKSIHGFTEAGHNEDDAFLYATLTFFGGAVFMKVSENGSIDGSDRSTEEGRIALHKRRSHINACFMYCVVFTYMLKRFFTVLFKSY
jgi:ZIP family zinc transporter